MGLLDIFKKKEKPADGFRLPRPEKSFDEQLVHARLQLDELSHDFNTIINQQLAILKDSKKKGRMNDNAEGLIKNAYYAMVIVERAKNELSSVTTNHAFAASMNRLSDTLGMINKLSGDTAKVHPLMLQRNLRGLEKVNANAEAAVDRVFRGTINDLVDASLISRLESGDTAYMCLKDEDGIVGDIAAEQPEQINLDNIQSVGGFDNDHVNATLGDLNDLINNLQDN